MQPCRLVVLVTSLFACAPDYQVDQGEEIKVPVAQPDTSEPASTSPDWANCDRGWAGSFYNLPADHPDFGNDSLTESPFDTSLVDWWDDAYFSFQRFDATLDFGPGWSPVDEGLPEDPSWFTARWLGWAYVEGDAPAEIHLAAGSDVWVKVGDQIYADLHAGDPFEARSQVVNLPPGQSPVEVSFAHRRGEPGLSVRFSGEQLHLCYPEWTEGN